MEESNPQAKPQTGFKISFRVSEDLYDEIEQMAKACEVSKNALMTMAIRIGLGNLKPHLESTTLHKPQSRKP